MVLLWVLLIAAVVSMGGCALLQSAPTLRYCDHVQYERTGRDINVTAHCFEAVEPAFAVPVPKP